MLDTLLDKEELSLVILVENEDESFVILVENDALAATKFEAVVSVFVTLVEKDPDAVSKLVSLVDIEPDPKQLTAKEALVALEAV